MTSIKYTVRVIFLLSWVSYNSRILKPFDQGANQCLITFSQVFDFLLIVADGSSGINVRDIGKPKFRKKARMLYLINKM